MRTIFCAIAICGALSINGQNEPMLRKIPQTYQPNMSLLDTSKTYASKYGDVARLTLDNMPCILPYKNPKPIPTEGKNKSFPKDIPNIWMKAEPFRFKSAPIVKPTAPKNKSITPYLKKINDP